MVMAGSFSSSTQKCLICLNYLKPHKKPVPPHGSKEQLLIMYFLRKLAWDPIPDQDLKTFLQLGNPSEWAPICYICEEELKNALELHSQVGKLISQLTDIRKRLYENFFEMEGEEEVEVVPAPPPPRSKRGGKDVFKQLRHQLFAEFKKRGQDTGGFDKAILISYNKASSRSRTSTIAAAATTRVKPQQSEPESPTTTAVAPPMEPLQETSILVKKEVFVPEMDTNEVQDPDFAEIFDSYWGDDDNDNHEDAGYLEDDGDYSEGERERLTASAKTDESFEVDQKPSMGAITSSTRRLRKDDDDADYIPSTKPGPLSSKRARPTSSTSPRTGQPKKTRRKYSYELLRTFPTLEEAKDHIRQEKLWKIHNKVVIQDGTKITYDCKFGVKRTKNVKGDCLAKIYLMMPEDEDHVELYSTSVPHQHPEDIKVNGLKEPEKAKIRELYGRGLKLRRMMKALQKEGMQPKSSQVASYIQYNIRRKEMGVKGARGPGKRGRPPRPPPDQPLNNIDSLLKKLEGGAS